jgi:ribose transport system substrate-binding protein
MNRMSPRTRVAVLALTALSLAVALTACGSSGSNSSTGASSEGASSEAGSPETVSSEAGSSAVAKAQANVKKFSATQPPIEVPALSKKPPAGVRFAIMSCTIPVCQQEVEGAQEGAEDLGWKVSVKTSELTPEGYLKAWEQILKEKPEAIAYVGVLPNEAIKKQLAQVKAEGIPTVIYAPNGEEIEGSGPPSAAITGEPVFRTDGQLMGEAVVADADGPANAVYVVDPTFAPWVTTEETFDEAVEGAGGTVEQLKVSETEIGKGVPSAIASYLRAHPDVEYVALAVNDFGIGLSAALKGAGIAEKVKVISRAPSAANMTEIANGEQWASVADENVAAGWRITDALARIFNEESLEPCCVEPDGWHQIFTKENATPEALPQTPGVPDSFLSAWHVK